MEAGMKKGNHSYIERIKTILKGPRYLTQALDDNIKMADFKGTHDSL